MDTNCMPRALLLAQKFWFQNDILLPFNKCLNLVFINLQSFDNCRHMKTFVGYLLQILCMNVDMSVMIVDYCFHCTSMITVNFSYFYL